MAENGFRALPNTKAEAERRRNAQLRTQTIFLIALIGLLAGCYSHNANSDLRLTLNTHGIEEVDVLKVPESVTSPVDLTAEKLEHGYHARLELRGGALLDHVDDLGQALARTECKESSRSSGDLRVAVVFFGTGHKRIKSFYYALQGKGGQVDEAPCQLSPGLYQWVRKNLPD